MATLIRSGQPKQGGEMGMLMRTEQPVVDTYGLPIYKVTKTIEERVGDEVRIVCGYEMFGQTVWTHIVIMTPDDLAESADRCQQIATLPERQSIHVAG
jgi:hypothetical protein